MSVALLERLGQSTPDQPIRGFNPDVVSGSLPRWENRETKQSIGHPLAGSHTGWQLYRRIDPSDQSDYSQNSANILSVHQRSYLYGEVTVNFAGQPNAGWVVEEVDTFNVGRNGDITFKGRNGKYKISNGGNRHSFEPSDESKRRIIEI